MHACKLTPRICCLLLALLAPDLFAREKTDNIRLVNGNEITGEVKQLLRGTLSYGTASMGTIGVEWKDVSQLESSFHYEIRMEKGRRFYGSLALAGRPGEVRVLLADGEEVVRTIDIVELRPIEHTLRERLDIRLGAGYSYTRASKVTTFNLRTDIGYQDEKGISSLSGRTTLTDNDGDRSDSNRYKVSREVWTSRPQVVRWFDASYEDNDELQLDYRYTVGFGLGRAVIDDNRNSLIAYLGVQAATERDMYDETLDSVEGVLGASYSAWRFDTPELDLQLDFTLYPGITESDRLRGDAGLRWSWELVEDLYWDISAWLSYDSAARGRSDSDYGVTTGLSWSY